MNRGIEQQFVARSSAQAGLPARAEVLLQIKGLHVHFPYKRGLFSKSMMIKALDGISFDVYQGETLGIVGESGSGKSTLAKTIIGLNEITRGEITFANKYQLATATKGQWHHLHRKIQLIFQDPVAALNPRMTVAEIIAEPLKIYFPQLKASEINDQVVHMLQLVGLPIEQMNHYPSEFSGGQCQRIGIARALILGPKLLICDEAISALDVSIKAQIINLLKELQQKLHLTIIFISHDLSAVKYLSNRVLVMYFGQLMELQQCNNLYTNCHHPYTSSLLNAMQYTNVEAGLSNNQRQDQLLVGELPSIFAYPQGCVFASRCQYVQDNCRNVRPPLSLITDNSVVSCHYPLRKVDHAS